MTDKNQDIELDNDETIEEMHDPKNAEKQSVDSVDKAAKAVKKKAPKRTGDKDMSEPMGKVEKGKVSEEIDIDVDFSEDLNALVESEATLSEDFKAKTAVIFEAALKTKLSEEVDRLEEQYATELAEEVDTIKTDLVEKVDSYLNYVVETWMEDNKLAVNVGLRTEIAENFMTKLKDVFIESHIEVPEDKIDLVDDLAEQVEDLEEAVNISTVTALELAEELESYKRADIIREAARDLADTQVEKLSDLVENIDFDDEDSFTAKVATLKESYFGKKPTNDADELVDDFSSDTVETSAAMEHYLAAIRKNNK